MLFEVLKYDGFGNCAVGCREIPAPPKSAAPIAPAQIREFPLHLVGRTTLHLAHEIGTGELWRHRNKHVDVVAR